jgi:hypothetical protein
MVPTSDVSRTGRRSTSGLSRNEEMVRGCGIAADPVVCNVEAVRVRDTGRSESVSSAQSRKGFNFTLHNTLFVSPTHFTCVVRLVLRTGNDLFPYTSLRD